jgi:Zn-dependent metalloprotease
VTSVVDSLSRRAYGLTMALPPPPVHPIECILPPYMLDALKLRGSPEQREMALRLEGDCRTYRLRREQAAPPASVRPAARVAAEEARRPRREVYDAGHGTRLPGTLRRKEGDEPAGDGQVDEAYDGAGDTWRLYFDQYERDSLDGRGMALVSTVHYGREYNNAFWNGDQMVYGDGDGVIFTPFTASLSVIGHELSHGVVQYSGGLVYQDEAGALNESFADVFGVLTVQHRNDQTTEDASWLIGDGILGPDIHGEALRSMKAPGTAYDDEVLGTDPQPYHMDLYVHTSSDNGGVHINSGIPNHAFYLLARYLGGKAWERAGRIWYDTMQSINNPHATFAQWADKTVERARTRYGEGSLEALFTRRAWKLVGITV